MARSRSASRSRSRSASRSPLKRREGSADAEITTCPFLIRLFISKNRHTPMMDFDEGQFPIRDEFQAYGWKTSTPTSLITLLYPSLPPQYRSPAARFSVRHIYVDASQRGLYRHRDLVSFTGRDLISTVEEKPVTSMDMELDSTVDHTRKGRKVDEKTLDEYGFITGDLLSVSIHVPEPKLHPGPNRPPIGINGSATGERGGFGWGDRSNGPPVPALGREVHPADKAGTWSRGEALPPAAGRPRGSLNRDAGRDVRGLPYRGSRDGLNDMNGGELGIRGAGRRRSASPPRERDGRRDSGSRRRSRSRSFGPRDR